METINSMMDFLDSLNLLTQLLILLIAGVGVFSILNSIDPDDERFPR